MRALTLLLLVGVASAAERPARLWSDLPEIVRTRPILWHDPGRIESLDLRFGPGGRSEAPRPPFQFIKEDPTGSTPKILARDSVGRQWAAKFGDEAKPDTFCSRLAWALGYFVEANYFVERGTFVGAHDLKRARTEVDSEGHFNGGARFQLRAKEPQYLSGVSWSWRDNPFTGTREFNGLRILMMLVSNWDDKDIRDENERGLGSRYREIVQEKKRGSNNAIFKTAAGQFLFFIDDWGASMGACGGPMERTKWDCVDYANQSARFVRIKDGALEWGYRGIHTSDMTEGLRVADIQWLMQYLGRISDRQLQDGLRAGGATPDEAYCYTRALRMRIEQLREVARGQAVTRAR